MKKLFSFVLVAVTIIACSPSLKKQDVSTAVVDSLTDAYVKAWNAHDSVAVKNMFTNDAVLIDDAIVAHGTAEIASKWITPFMPAVNNLKSNKLQEWYSDLRAGYTGNYEFQYYDKDSTLRTTKGFYSMVWMKTENGEWKITSDIIHGTE